jgi:hypothetical protein
LARTLPVVLPVVVQLWNVEESAEEKQEATVER